MKEYKIKITGEYDVLVLSPKMIAGLIDKIRGSDTREIVIPAEEIFPQGYAEYLNRVLEANAEVAKNLPDRSAYTWIAEQMQNMQFDEKDCFDRACVTELEQSSLLDMETSEAFYIVTKLEQNQFRYAFQNENGEEVSILLEYL